jgi:HK97 family phage portal protein
VSKKKRKGSALVVAAKAEGDVQPGPFLLSEGWLPASTPWNFWQTGGSVTPYGSRTAMVEACVSAYSQTVAMCPGDHWRQTDDGGRERVETSPLARFLTQPNDYQSISDFLMTTTAALYDHGNAYALAIRDGRGAIEQMHPMISRQCTPRLTPDGEIFYDLSGNEIAERRFDLRYPVPARNVLHIKLKTPRHFLKGEPPLLAAALEVAASDAIMRQQIAFFLNQARPSMGLSTDLILDPAQVAELRTRWNEQSRGLNQGGTPILTAGLKPVTFSSTSADAQLAEMLKTSAQNIALTYRLPLQVLGIGGTPFASTELLMQSWIAQGLGFALNHIEESIGNFFGLRGYPREYLELNTEALLRSALKDRIEALARGVQGGIYTINEARRKEDKPDKAGGDEPRVQQQMVPLSYGAAMKPPDPNATPPTPEPKPAPEPDDTEAENDDEKRYDPASVRARLQAASAPRLH